MVGSTKTEMPNLNERRITLKRQAEHDHIAAANIALVIIKRVNFKP